MNRFVRGTCLSIAVGGWLLATAPEALGQLDCGVVLAGQDPAAATPAQLRLQVIGPDGSPLEEGGILVPARPAMTASYAEVWIVPANLIGLHDESVLLEPLKSDEELSIPETKDGLHDLSTWSNEVEITDAMLNNNEVDALVEAAHASNNDKLGAVFREVWQLVPDVMGNASWQRTAFVYASSTGTAVTETWLLSSQYVYPSPDNGVAMELRYIQHDATPDAGSFSSYVRAQWKPVRLISVDIQDLGPSLGSENEKYLVLASNSPTPEAGFSTPWTACGEANTLLWCVTGALGAAIARGRRPHDGRQA